MIFGQSGGGAKCATLMAMPAAKGLFHRVVTMSGQQLTARTPQHATESAEAVLAALGLSRAKLEDIRDPAKVPMEKLVAAIRAGKYFGPVLDGRRAAPRSLRARRSPLSADVPMILGNAHDETRLLIGGGDPSLFSLTWDELPSRLERYRQFLGDLKTADIIADYRRWYPAYTPSDVFFAVTTAFRSWHGMRGERPPRRATVPDSKRAKARPGPTTSPGSRRSTAASGARRTPWTFPSPSTTSRSPPP